MAEREEKEEKGSSDDEKLHAAVEDDAMDIDIPVRKVLPSCPGLFSEVELTVFTIRRRNRGRNMRVALR